jgi:hypothetical protein
MEEEVFQSRPKCCDLREFRRRRGLLAGSQVASAAAPFARYETNSLPLHRAQDFDGRLVQRDHRVTLANAQQMLCHDAVAQSCQGPSR